MKRIISSIIVLAALAYGTAALAAAFTAGNLVIYREGGNASGATSGGLTNAGTVVWLDEYNTSGVFQTSHMMPTNYFGANSPLLANGTAFGNGLITLSVDGRFILVPGYGAELGDQSSSLGTTFATQVPRVIGAVGGNGNIDTTTTLTNNASGGSSGGEIRSVVSTDGTNFWTAGDALSAGGAQYTTLGSSDAITFNGLNTRQMQILNNQIYLSSASLIGNHIAQLLNTNNVSVLPTATNDVVTTNLVGTANPPSPWAFVGFKLNAGGSDPIDTLYVADGSNFVWKLSKVGTSWSNDGSIRAGSAVGVAGQIRASTLPGATNVDLWITGGGGTLSGNDNLYAFTDSTGYHVPTSGNANLNILATSANSVSFRGIVLAPVGGVGTLSGSGNISVGPVVGLFANGDTGCALSSSSATQTYSIANLGTTGPVAWQASCDGNWVSFSPSSGSLPSGGSVTVSAFLNANVVSLPGSLAGVTNTATIMFTNTTNHIGDTTRAVRLIQRDQDITPTTDYVITGPPGGPSFSPASKTYTLFNGSNVITLAVSKTASWLDLSATSIPLAGCTKTSITVSVNANANSLAVGNYSDVVSFSNATAGTLIDTRTVNLTVGGVFFCDDFSTFTQNAIVEGQKGWVALNANPSIGVSNNAVWQPASTTAVDEPWKNIPVTTNGNIYEAMVIVVESAQPLSTVNPLRMTCFLLNQNGSGFAVDYLTARDTGTGTFVFGIRKNGAGNNSAFGTTAFNYGSTNKVIVQADVSPADSFMALYVNPTGAPSDNNTTGAYVATNNVGAIDSGVGSISLQGQFTSGAASPGYHVYKLCVTSSGTDAYNDLASFGPPPDPFTTWQSQYFGCTGCPQADGNADPYGKGMSNTNQFLAGFDPTNTAASVRILNVATTSGVNVTVTYRGANGNSTTTPPSASRTNVLEATLGSGNGSYTSTNFVSTGQTNILSGGSGAGAVTSFIDTNGTSNATKYYRVKVLVP